MAQVIVALDVPTLDEAMGLVDSLGDGTDFYKVGLELCTPEGPSVVQALAGKAKSESITAGPAAYAALFSAARIPTQAKTMSIAAIGSVSFKRDLPAYLESKSVSTRK